MPLREYKTHEEIRHFIADLTRNGLDDDLPENQALINVAKFVTEGLWTSSAIRFFSYPADRPLYAFVTEMSTALMPNVHARPPTETHDYKILREAVPLIFEEIREGTQLFGKFLIETEQDIADQFIEVLVNGVGNNANDEDNNEIKSSAGTMCLKNDSGKTTPFYMNKEQRAALCQKQLTLPDGFVFDTVDAPNEYKKIHMAWPYHASAPAESTKARLAQLPNLAIREQSTGNLAAWEFTHTLGMMTHLFTLEEYRKQGLGMLAELKLSQMYSEMGWKVFKHVAVGNTAVVKASTCRFQWKHPDQGSEAHPLWTTWKGRNGHADEPVKWAFTLLHLKEHV